MEESEKRKNKIIGLWLLAGALMVFIQVMVGGITRLTGSGLSITEWNVVGGTLPPLTEHDWELSFDRYKKIPQFERINSSMTLQGYKHIFFWEWFHRLWARLMGVAFLIPFILFLIKKWLTKKFFWQLLFLFFLGGLEGAIGWIMVASGLSELTWVSPYKLTLHLLMALLISGFLLWMSLGLLIEKSRRIFLPKMKNLSIAVFILLIIQIGLGGMMSGIHAAVFFPTWPLYHGYLMPPTTFDNTESWHTILENPAFVQFFHRNIGYVIAGAVVYFWILGSRKKTKGFMRTLQYFSLLVVSIQILLGILILLNTHAEIPVWFGVMHQSVAWILFYLAVTRIFLLTGKKPAQ